jgi:hypothetical protein
LSDPFRLPNDDSDVPNTSIPSVSQLSDEVFKPPRPKMRTKPAKETFMTWTIVSVKRPFEEVVLNLVLLKVVYNFALFVVASCPSSNKKTVFM